MRVAIYARISPNPDKKDVDNQVSMLTEYANRMGWTIAETYQDILVSGGKKGADRVAFSKMMEDARLRKFDCLLFWSLDRFSREGVLETLQYLEKLGSYKVEFKSYTEQYLDSLGIFKEAVLSILATIAKQEKIRLSERTRAGLRTALIRGKKLGRSYATQITKKRHIAYDPVEARRMRDSGMTMKEIAERFKVDQSTVSRYLRKQDA